MGQQNKIGSHKTTISKQNNFTFVTYHKTNVVSFDDKVIYLDNGGYFTATTKTRMNQAANQFGLGFRVFQKAGDWFVALANGETRAFYNGAVNFLR